MSGGLDATALKEEDITKFLGCSTHLGASNVDFQMEQYVYKRKPEGISWHCQSKRKSADLPKYPVKIGRCPVEIKFAKMH